MTDEAAVPRCYSLVIWILLLSLGLFAIIQIDRLSNSLLPVLLFFQQSSMENGEAKEASADSGNAFTRIFTSCTSFVRSVTKPDGHTESRLRKHSRSKDTVKRTASNGRHRLQKPFSSSQKSPRPNQQGIMPSTPLFKVIEDGTFWTVRDDALLILIRDEFPQELNRLKSAYSVRTTGVPRPSKPSISQILYHEDYDEINRTLIGVLALRWVWLDDYSTFIGSHTASPTTLKRASFRWMRDMFHNGLREPIDIYALVVSMIINDLGKDHNLASDYCTLKTINISNVNHDMILLYAVEANMIPALDRLPRLQKSQLITGIKLGAEFNFGQLAQGENAPASLSGLLNMRGEDRAFEMRFMEQLLDLSGASGHEDWTCARKMIEPIFQSYRNVYDAARGIISGELNLREAYDIIPARKLELLKQAGWDGALELKKDADRALARLFCLGNTNSKDTADLYTEAFQWGIDNDTRSRLIKGLNVDGSVDQPAVQTTYAPAMLSKATANTPHGSREESVAAIAAVLGYLTRCFDVAPDESLKFKQEKVMVIERDVRIIDTVVGGEKFKQNPSQALSTYMVPEGVPANFDRS